MRELGSSLCRGADSLQHLASLRDGSLALEQVGVAQDGRQHVVEVVGEPTCQGTDGLGFLRLQQLPFETFLLGYILNGTR